MLDQILLALPWGIGPFAYLGVQLLKLLPPVINAIKSHPADNKESAPIVVDAIKKSVEKVKQESRVGDPPELKNI